MTGIIGVTLAVAYLAGAAFTASRISVIENLLGGDKMPLLLSLASTIAWPTSLPVLLRAIRQERRRR